MKKYKRLPFLSLIILLIVSLFSCREQQKIDLTIMSYNIKHGMGMDTILDLSRSASIINSIAPDLCAIQEVDNFCLRSDSISQTNYLSQSTEMVGTFGKFMEFQGGEYGMATLTKKPIVSTRVLQLPDGKYEPRSSIVQKIQIAEDCIIVFANVHFEWISGKEGSDNRLKQARALVNHIDSLNRPVIITGDFNCTPDSPTMQYFTQQGFVFVQKGEDNLSFQGRSQSEIDHLIFRDQGDIKFVNAQAYLINEPVVSDHRPLVVQLDVTYW